MPKHWTTYLSDTDRAELAQLERDKHELRKMLAKLTQRKRLLTMRGANRRKRCAP